jgi:hypothetical protein
MRQPEKNCEKIVEELWKNCRKILRTLVRPGKNCGNILVRALGGEELWKNCGKKLRVLNRKYFYNSSTVLLQFFLVWKNLVHPDWLGEEL